MSSRPVPPTSTRPTRERDQAGIPLRPMSPIDADIPRDPPRDELIDVPDDPERDPQNWIDEDTGTERVDRDPENPPAPTSEDIADRDPPDRTLR